MEKKKEKDVETYLEKTVIANGGFTCKFVSVQRRGVPDRVVCFPQSGTTFVEVKRPGEKPREQQIYVMTKMTTAGARCTWVSTKEEVDDLIQKLTGGDCN